MIGNIRVQNHENAAKYKSELLSFTAELDPIELVAQMALIHLVIPEETQYWDREDVCKLVPRIEYLTALLLQNSFPSDISKPVQGPEIEQVSSLLDSYFTSVMLSETLGSKSKEDDGNMLAVGQKLALFNVRGENSPNRLYAMAEELYGPHNNWLVNSLGFYIQDAILLCKRMPELIEDRFNLRIEQGQKAFDEKCVEFSKLASLPEHDQDESQLEIAQYIQENGIEEAAAAFCTHTIFKDLGSIVGFTTEELYIATEQQIPKERLFALLDRLSITFGQVSKSFVTPFDYNPLREKPLVHKDGKYYFFLCPYLCDVVFETFHFDIWRDTNYRGEYDKIRSEWLERRALAAFKKMLPGCDVYHDLKYRYDGKDCQLDGLVILDDKVLLIEAKSKKLTRQARLGDTSQLTVDLRAAIENAFYQGKRAKDYINSSNDIIEFTDSSDTKIVLSHIKQRKFYLISITLSVFPEIAANLSRSRSIGLFQTDEYPWAVSISDLDIIAEMIEFPTELLHYMDRRLKMQQDPRFLFYDELDVFGCYQQQRLYFDTPEFKKSAGNLMLGFSEEIDNYIHSTETSGNTSLIKPKLHIPLNIIPIIKSVESSNQLGRFDFTLALLDFSAVTLEQLLQYVEQANSLTIADGNLHSVSTQSHDGSLGIAYMVVKNMNPVELSKRLYCFTLAKKYQTKSLKWIGFAHDVSYSNPVQAVTYAENEWITDPEMERLLPYLNPGKPLAPGNQ